MKVYISGKISGKEPEARQEFSKAAKLLSKSGLTPVNPFDNGLNEDDTWEKHLAVDIKALLECDAILQLPGWEDSRGARLEYEVAQVFGIPVIIIKAEL